MRRTRLPMSTRQKARAARSGARDSKTKMTSRASKNSTRRTATIGQTAHGADFHGMVAAANASDAGQEWSRRIKTRFACTMRRQPKPGLCPSSRGMLPSCCTFGL